MNAACPSCPPVLEARALVLSEAFWTNVTYAVLPFAIVLAVIVSIVRRVDRGITLGEDHGASDPRA